MKKKFTALVLVSCFAIAFLPNHATAENDPPFWGTGVIINGVTPETDTTSVTTDPTSSESQPNLDLTDGTPE